MYAVIDPIIDSHVSLFTVFRQDNPEEEKEDPAHQEIQKMMDSLFLKLDALSNYHFTPKPVSKQDSYRPNNTTITQ